MISQTTTLEHIREVWRRAGPEVAAEEVRAALEAGLLHPLYVPEIFLAFKTGRSPFLNNERGEGLRVRRFASLLP